MDCAILDSMEKWIRILEGYEKCDPQRLDRISDQLYIPVSFLMNGYLSDRGDVAQENLNDLSIAFKATADKPPPEDEEDERHQSAIRLLMNINREQEVYETDKLPFPIFQKIATAVSIYSSHHAYPDGSKDTFKKNGIVAHNYVNLIASIVQSAEEATDDAYYLPILGILYRNISSLSEDACNQQNAVEFARLLQRFEPL